MPVDFRGVLSILADSIPYILAWWVGMFFVFLGLYVIFITERSDPPLITFGLFDLLLGVGIYLTVRFPEWTPSLLTRELLVTAILLLLFCFVAMTTWLIWAFYELDPPHIRVKALLIGWLFRFRHSRQKLSDDIFEDD